MLHTVGFNVNSHDTRETHNLSIRLFVYGTLSWQ